MHRNGIAKERAVRTTTGLDGVTALPDHGGDGAALHVCKTLLVLSRVDCSSNWEEEILTREKTGEERLLLQVSV